MAHEPVTCTTCELHAEAVFRVEGMDCNEEVVILERRLKPLAGMEAVAADVIRQRLHVKYDAAKLTTSSWSMRSGRPGCGCGSSTRSRVRPGRTCSGDSA